MPLITDAFDYFAEEEPDIAKDFLSALSIFRTKLNDYHYPSKDDTSILDSHIGDALYTVAGICETIKTTYSQHPAAEEIIFAADLEHVTLNELRNYFFHDFIIPENIDEKLQLKKELSDLLYQLKCNLNKENNIDELSKNTFLKKVDDILKKQHAFDHFSGQNVFMKVRNIEELCGLFPKSIYAISGTKTSKAYLHEQRQQEGILNKVIFTGNECYFSLLNNLDKPKDFEQPIEMNNFSQQIKKSISEALVLWAEDSFQDTDYLVIQKKLTPKLQKFRENLLQLSKEPINFETNRFSEISDFLSKKFSEADNSSKQLGSLLKIKACMKIIQIIQEKQKDLMKLLKANTNEIDEPLVKRYIFGFKNIFSTINDLRERQITAGKEKIINESRYQQELQIGLKYYHSEPEEYKKFIDYLIRAIQRQASDKVCPFLKQCTNLIITFEDHDHPHSENLAREAFLSEINSQFNRIIGFIKILRNCIENPRSNNTEIPLCEIYSLACKNACVRSIENIEVLTEDILIQTQIAYIRSELNMRSPEEIKTLALNEKTLLELLSSYSGIGRCFSDYRHHHKKLSPKTKESIKLIYSAFSKETPYSTPKHPKNSTFTNLFKRPDTDHTHDTEEGNSATAYNVAIKAIRLCSLSFNSTLKHRLNALNLHRKDSTLEEMKLEKPTQDIIAGAIQTSDLIDGKGTLKHSLTAFNLHRKDSTLEEMRLEAGKIQTPGLIDDKETKIEEIKEDEPPEPNPKLKPKSRITANVSAAY